MTTNLDPALEAALRRSIAARQRAARTVARARFTDDLRVAHRDGRHTDAETGSTDPSGYWTEVGCPGCCTEVLA